MATAAQCTAHSSRTGERCRKAPIKGAAVCATHGGRAGQVRAAAEARVTAAKAQADAAAVLAHHGLTGVDDPLEELSLLAREAREFQAALAARVNALRSIRAAGGALPMAEVALYERAMDRAGRFLKDLASLKFEEKREARARAVAVMLFQVLEMAVVGMGESFEEGAPWRLAAARAAERLEAGEGPMFAAGTIEGGGAV